MNAMSTLMKLFLVALLILLGPIILIVIGVSFEILKYILFGLGILLLPVIIGVVIGVAIRR